MDQQPERKTVKLTDEQIIKIVELYEIFYRIHVRLINEGYTRGEDGRLVPPPGMEEPKKARKYTRKPKQVS